MQDQEGFSTPNGRLRLALCIVAVILLGILLWLIFFRSSPKEPSSSTTATKQHQPSGGQPSVGSNGSDTPPSQLANTGAGNVLGLVAATSVAAGLLYQVKLRKRLSQ